MIIVTGGAGFIGSNLVAGLEARGAGGLLVCDRLDREEKRRNIAGRALPEPIAPEDLLALVAREGGRIDAIFHMGAISSTTETDGDLIMRTNFDLPLRLWQLCAEHGIRLIYASSAATYGDGAAGFDDDGGAEALARLKPLNLYGWSKHLFDRRVARLVDMVSLSVTFDLPFFRSKRQDRSLGAALSQRRAADQSREEVLRRLSSQLESEHVRWRDLGRRLDLYERTILSISSDNAVAALAAYQSDAGDFAEVMRAYLDDLNTRTDYIRLQVERAQSFAMLANLGGIPR